MDRRHERQALFWGACVAAAVAVPMWLFAALDRLDVETPLVRLDAVWGINDDLVALEASRRPSRRVALLGDSTAVSYPEGRAVPDQLARALHRPGEGAATHVHPVTAPGLDAFSFYFVSDAVVRAGADVVVVLFNLASLSPSWRDTFARPELAGFVAPSQIPAALALPIQWAGLTADRLLAYASIVRLGGFAPWYELTRQQARAGTGLAALRRWIDRRLGNRASYAFALVRSRRLTALTRLESDSGGGERATAAGMRRRYRIALAGVDTAHPVVRMLGAAVERYRSLGVPVVVYLAPMNVEHARDVGVLDAARLDDTIAVLERVVTEAGGRPVDLHDLLPDAGFRDPMGHLRAQPPADGPRRVALTLAPYVREALSSSGGALRRER